MKALRLLGFLFLLSFGATLFFLQLASPGGAGVERVRIEITPGQTVREIAEIMKREGLVRSATLFRMYLQSRGIDRELRAGTFLFPPGSTLAEMADALASGAGEEIVVTIPEGFTIAQIDDLLARMGLTREGELLACARGDCDLSPFTFLPPVSADFRESPLEGYLFPDTYFVHAGDFTPQRFLERLLGTFHERVVEGLAADLQVSGRPLHEVITMASLIERETRTAEERPIVSGILWKRLASKRALDVDATIRYALRKPADPITKEDLQVDSPYNTRRYAGLPPGPIAHPGLASIKAALHPEDSRYWYYLHGSDGGIRYAETNEGHNENKAKYL